MDEIAAFLIKKETITGAEFMEIYRRIEGIPEPDAASKDETHRITGGEQAEEKPDPSDAAASPAGQTPDSGKELDIRNQIKPV